METLGSATNKPPLKLPPLKSKPAAALPSVAPPPPPPTRPLTVAADDDRPNRPLLPTLSPPKTTVEGAGWWGLGLFGGRPAGSADRLSLPTTATPPPAALPSLPAVAAPTVAPPLTVADRELPPDTKPLAAADRPPPTAPPPLPVSDRPPPRESPRLETRATNADRREWQKSAADRGVRPWAEWRPLLTVADL